MHEKPRTFSSYQTQKPPYFLIETVLPQHAKVRQDRELPNFAALRTDKPLPKARKLKTLVLVEAPPPAVM